MAKGERQTVDKLSTQQYGNVGSTYSAITGGLQAQQPAAQAQAANAYTAASGAANNLATTGGISPTDAAKMETAATRSVSGMADVMKSQAERKAAITGGYGGGGEIAQISRQGGQNAAAALTNADAAIAGLKQQGIIAGSQQLQSLYGMSANQANVLQNQILQATQAGIQLSQADIEMLAQMSKEPSGFSSVLGDISGVAGGVGGLLGGIGSI